MMAFAQLKAIGHTFPIPPLRPVPQVYYFGVVFFIILLFVVSFIGWLYESSRHRAIHSLKRSMEENMKLTTARNVADAANKAKSEFLAVMSHELRTPLNAIIGYAELLQDDFEEEKAVNDQQLQDLERIQRSGRDLLEIISNILDLSRIEAGKMELNVRPAPLEEVLETLEPSIQPMMSKQNNTFTLDTQNTDNSICTDPLKLRQILVNLLSNAAKFTKDGEVTLRVNREHSAQKTWWSFTVRDTGIGIRPEQKDMLFEMFTQGDSSSTRKYGGTGLGLAISKRLSHYLEGDIQVESEPGKGSTFTLRIPELPEKAPSSLLV